MGYGRLQKGLVISHRLQRVRRPKDQAFLHMFKQLPPLFAVDKQQGQPLVVVQLRFELLNSPVVRKRDVSRLFIRFKYAGPAGGPQAQVFNESLKIRVFPGRCTVAAAIFFDFKAVLFPTVVLIAEFYRAYLFPLVYKRKVLIPNLWGRYAVADDALCKKLFIILL